MTQQKPDENLPDLTAKQDALITHYLSGKSKRDAYIAAYNPQTDNYYSISKLVACAFGSVAVRAWLEYLHAHKLTTHAITLRDHLDTLESLRESAIVAGDISAAIRAEELRGKAAGLYIKRTESVRVDLTPQMILDKIAASGPDGQKIASQLAAAKSINWQPK